MNPLDIAIFLFGMFAVITGFNAGLLRSLATILAYALAVPVALVVSSRLADYLTAQTFITPDNAAFVPLVVLIVLGFLLGAVLRSAVGSLTGGHTVFIDRVLGALLGAVRVLLIAVLLGLVFNRIIPAAQMPSWYAESKLRPVLTAAGEQGLRSLPPQLADYIDRIKRERGL